MTEYKMDILNLHTCLLSLSGVQSFLVKLAVNSTNDNFFTEGSSVHAETKRGYFDILDGLNQRVEMLNRFDRNLWTGSMMKTRGFGP